MNNKGIAVILVCFCLCLFAISSHGFGNSVDFPSREYRQGNIRGLSACEFSDFCVHCSSGGESGKSEIQDRLGDFDPLGNSESWSITSTGVHHSGLPKIDEILFRAYPGASPETIVNGFIASETDWIRGPENEDLYNQVVASGHKVSRMDQMAQFTFFPINCRDYKVTSGEPNMPLNDSAWRLALSYVYGMDDRQADVSGYYGIPWQEALGNPVPPAQEPWYDAATVMPNTNWGTAWAILQSAGYAHNGNWLTKNGVEVRPGRNINCSYTNGTTVYPEGPMGGMVENWNTFIQSYLGLNGPLMELEPTDFTTLVTDLLAVRNYDIIGIGLTNLGRYVDWIFDIFHSANDVPWGWNFCGIHDQDFDRWGEIIVTSIDENGIISATENFTRKFVTELMPWMPAITGSDFCTTARDGRGELMNIVPMNNYGSMNSWSYMTVHWKGEPDVTWPGGTLTVALEDEAKELNPWMDNTLYSWDLMDRSTVGLLGVNPVTLKNMPFIATDWEISSCPFPELGIINGCQCTYWLRQDLTWHDGRPVTAHDCVANLQFLRTNKPGKYAGIWEHLVCEEADGPYKFDVYFDQTSLSYVDLAADIALLVPKHIIEVVEAVENYSEIWDPSQLGYADLGLGSPPAEYPFLKQLVGCGPFVFDYYDRVQDVGRLERYQDFFVSAPVIGSVVGEWRISPGDNYTYTPLVQNMAAMEADANSALTSVTVDVKIYEDQILVHELHDLHLDSWNWTYLGPYTTGNLSCGEHTITVEVYDSTDNSSLHTYTHKFVSTLREDITTYAGEIIDIMVDIKDVARAAKAFGTLPGHERWNAACDINDDFIVNMRDIGGIARRYGWRL